MRAIVAYVTNASLGRWQCGGRDASLSAEEFTDLYVFHLRGNQRTSGERSRKEGGKIFGSGSRAPIAISVFVKNPEAAEHGRIFFHDIGNYLDQKQKLAIIRDFGAVKGISNANGWARIKPDDQNDWLNQRDPSFEAFIKIGEKRDRSEPVLFENYSSGVKTQRDAWCFNFSKSELKANIGRMVDFYQGELKRLEDVPGDLTSALRSNPKEISWTRALYNDANRRKPLDTSDGIAVKSEYRPFTRTWLYFGRRFNEMVYQIPKLFPGDSLSNRVIMLKQRWSGEDQFALMVREIPELQTDRGTQCFPSLPLRPAGRGTRRPSSKASPLASQRRDAITDTGLAHFQAV